MSKRPGRCGRSDTPAFAVEWGDLRRAVAVVATHGEGVLALLNRTIGAPDDPRGFGQRVAQLRLAPLAIVDSHLDPGNASRSGVGDAAERQERAAVDVGDLRADRNRVDGRTGVHLPFPVPATGHPEPRFP